MRTILFFFFLPASLLILPACDDAPLPANIKPHDTVSAQSRMKDTGGLLAAELISPYDRSDGKLNCPDSMVFPLTDPRDWVQDLIRQYNCPDSQFDCPDSRFFPPIDLRDWQKLKVVNGRLPTHAETLSGASICTYSGNESMAVRPCATIHLPKLAYCLSCISSPVFDPVTSRMKHVPVVVVVIQMVQINIDTLVGYRYVTGGCGGALLRNFHFLTDEEVEKVVER